MQPESGDPVPQDLGTSVIAELFARTSGIAFIEDHVGGRKCSYMRSSREERPFQNPTRLLFYLRVLFGS